MRDAKAKFGPTFAGGAQIPADTRDADIPALDAIGVRGVRLNLVRSGSAGMEDLDRAARRVHDLVRRHVERYADASDLEPVAQRLAHLPAVSIAHPGLFQEGLPTLPRLAECGVRVKAPGFGRATLAVRGAIRAIARATPDVLSFGSDLPSQRARRPFAADDLAILRDAIDPALECKVTRDNAAAFHGLRGATGAGASLGLRSG